ncbi:Amidohydrolase family protein [Actinacidiphila guanduensis]|uniref:Amidohydrolase family protein n=2 Tax=Actinacidiphila guanduensis TaxID=310781 RepID=A0A1H0S155_9ACTN|nr:Amidohydrolase family protein [Actinacidiphila guanduensis]
MSDTSIYVHAATLSRESYRLIADTGGHVSVATESECSAGQGYPPVWCLKHYGIPVSLSTDTSAWWSGDMFSAMRATLNATRAWEHQMSHSSGETLTHCHLRASEVVEYATLGGARALSLDSRIGHISPGCEADFVLLHNPASPTVFPVLNPEGHVVFQAGRGGPAMTTLYCVTDGSDILVSTMKARGKAAAVRRNPKVSPCVLDEQWPPTYLNVYCDAAVDDDPRLAADVFFRIMGVMAGRALDPSRRAEATELAAREERVTLRLRPYATFATPPRHVYTESDIAGLTHEVSSSMPW